MKRSLRRRLSLGAALAGLLAVCQAPAGAEKILQLPTAAVCLFNGPCTNLGVPDITETRASLDVTYDDLLTGAVADGRLSADLRGQVRFRMRADELGVVASTALNPTLFSDPRPLTDTVVIKSLVPYSARFALHVEGTIVLGGGPGSANPLAPIDLRFVVFPGTQRNIGQPCEIVEVFGHTETGPPSGFPDDLVELYRSFGHTFKFRPSNDGYLSGISYWEPLIELNHDIVFSCPGAAGEHAFTYSVLISTGDNGYYTSPFSYNSGFSYSYLVNASVYGPGTTWLVAKPLVATVSVRNLPPGASISSESGAFANLNTPEGGPEMVPLGATTLVFEAVTQAGTTTLATGDVGPPPPMGFKPGYPPTYFDLTTDALFSGAVTVCIDYTDIAFADEANLRLFHFSDGAWDDHTVSQDTTVHTICAQVTSLSPFAVFESEANRPPIADAGADQTVSEGTAVALDGSPSSDPEGGALTYSWLQVDGPAVALSGAMSARPTFTAPSVGPGGATLLFEVTVSDDSGASDADQVAVLVQNANDPPVCEAARASQASLWPPNHGWVPIGIGGVSDPNGDQVVTTVTAVTQDEPVRGVGDGDTGPDAALSGNLLLLRAERSGHGNGRVYHVHFTADDGQGASCNGIVTVGAPHSMKPGQPIVDDGELYDSTQR